MKDKSIIQSSDFTTFVKEIKSKIYSAKSQAIVFANRFMIELYFEIGREIVQKQENLGWGKSVVEVMSKELKDEFGEKSGYSTQNLWYMRQFYLSYKDTPNLQQLVGEIPWGSNILIFSKCKEYDEKKYYIKSTIENSWNRNVLMHHIKTDLFQRDKLDEKSNNFEVSLPNELSQLSQDIVKNDKVKMPHENPSIGIILCTDKDGLEVEYALQNIEQAMGISTYTIKEELPKELENVLPTSKELENVVKEDLEELS